ncbi:MIF4G-like type 3 [Botryosphaeria dothidea]|uniref:MIF4G-like type 3 n=1 Tax=Botryosphaeria dothidea TaxID=55169 RepID=A0A8H4MX19_9PEZI|nr:MIF4G-like type 3 [Botryosphaeria dothidea]
MSNLEKCFEDRQTNYEKQVKAQEKLLTKCSGLGGCRRRAEMPDLREKDTSTNAGDGSIGLRRFYENLIDLKDRVSREFYSKTVKKKKGDGDDQEDPAKPAEAKPAENEDQSTAIANKSVGAQVDALFGKTTRSLSARIRWTIPLSSSAFLNSKASGIVLSKQCPEIPKGRTDLLPLYARLVADARKHMPDVIQGIVAYLDDEFRSLQRRKQKDFLGQVRMINVRYLAELTKFGAVPEHVIFHCLKRKKTASHLGQQERMLIENAMYYVNPPERAAIEQKERTPLELFLRKLIYLDLTKRNLDKVVKQIRKLHWEEEEVVGMLHKIFTKPGKIKYSNVHLLAVILGSLNRHHQDFCISVIDDLLENITFGLELNDFKFNQRRVAEVKYLGELYIYRMVDSPVIFDTLYKIVTFGHEGGTPKPGAINPLDPPDDFFRIRLVCNLLETCGMYYDKGQAKKKLDFFLNFFQYYIHTKDQMPMDIEFMVQDAYALTRPQWKLSSNLEEAGNTFAEAVKANYQLQASGRTAEQEEQDEDSGAEDGEEGDGGDDDEPQARERNDASSGEDGDTPGEEEQDSSDSSSEDEEEHIVVTRPEDERDPEADAEFDPAITNATADENNEQQQQHQQAEAAPTMKFALLSRRGNKQQTKSIDLPADSTFAIAMRTQQEAERAEQQRIKNLVLNYDLRDENESDATRQPAEQQLPQNGNSQHIPSFKPNKTNHNKLQQSKNDTVNTSFDDQPGGLEKQHNPYNVPRIDKASNNRSTQRARKLQLSDVDWYDKTIPTLPRTTLAESGRWSWPERRQARQFPQERPTEEEKGLRLI